MAVVERSALLAHPRERLVALVQDIERYPQFLPGCVSAAVDRREGPLVQARLGFQLPGLVAEFATENETRWGDDGAQVIALRLLRGPFKRLDGEWRFTALGENASKVALRVQLDFGSRAVEALLGGSLQRTVDAVLRAFKQRAGAVDG